MVCIRAHALSTVTYYKILHLVGGLPPVVLAVLFAKITSPSNVKLVSVARIAPAIIRKADNSSNCLVAPNG